MRNTLQRKRSPYYFAIALSLIAFAVYLPALRYDFVWDDYLNVVRNRHITSLGLPFLKWAFTDVTVSYWQPVVWISHAVDYALWGLNPLGHHLTNVVLHGLNTFLVVLLVLRLVEAAKASRPRSGGPPLPDGRFGLIAAGVTGLLFGIHPVHVESVAWVTERKDLLSTLFFLVTLLAWLRYAGGRSWTSAGAFLKDRRYLASLSLFVLALASKPMVVTLPLVLLLLDWHPLGRIASRKDLAPSLVEKIPFLAPSLVLSAVTVWAHRALGVVKSLNEVSLLARLESAARAAVFYLVKMVLPLHLSPYYPDPKTVPVLSFGYLGGLVLVAAITAVCLFLAKRRRSLIPAAWGYYVVTLLPVLGLIKTNAVTVADRFTYLPGIGPFLLIGLAAAWVWERAERKGRGFRRAAAATAVVLCLVLTVLTIRQIGTWKNGIVFWTAVIEKEGDQAPVAYSNRAAAYQAAGNLALAIADFTKAITLDHDPSGLYVNRGLAFQDTGQLDKAIEDYSTAIRLRPGFAVAYNNRGLAFKEKGNLDGAMEDFNEAIHLDPKFADAYTSRGWTFDLMGMTDRALQDFNAAIALDPTRYIAYNDRGMVYQRQGRLNRAIEDFTKAIGLNPFFAQALTNRGLAYEQMGRTDLALADYGAAVDADPTFANAYNNRGLIYERMGRLMQALQDFNMVIAMNPGGEEAYNNRGLVLEDLGRYDEAVENYAKAIELQPDDAVAYNNRGIALAKKGRFDKAVRDHTKALALAPTFAEAYLARADCYRQLGKTKLADRDERSACDLGNETACETLRVTGSGNGN